LLVWYWKDFVISVLRLSPKVKGNCCYILLNCCRLIFRKSCRI